MSETTVAGRTRRILWVDDEVDLLRPHLMLLEEEGYDVDPLMNGDDALEMLGRRRYDLVLLDEQMPGLRGIEVLIRIRKIAPRLPVVMVTKSEADSTMDEAIGRQVEGYLVKPASPRQVLSAVKRLLEGPALRHERIARDFTRRFSELRESLSAAPNWEAMAAIFSEMADWELRLEGTGESGLGEVLETLHTDLRRAYADLVDARYSDWVHAGGEEGPLLSVDVLEQLYFPLLRQDPAALLIVMDCMRLDQWRAVLPRVAELFEVEEVLYAGILPTATPFARNAIFSGFFPDELAERFPQWWGSGDEAGYNSFEDRLFRDHVQELAGEAIPTHYEKIFSDTDGEAMLGRLPGYLSERSATAVVFGFVDLLTHGRSESRLLFEIARDAAALRQLTVTWFERSAAFRALREAARRGVPVLLTTDHGSIRCRRPVTVYAKRDATSNLRYKFGDDLRAETPSAVLIAQDADALRLPPGGMKTNYLVCREDYFMVYPTKLREYQQRYQDSFLHGGVSPEEMVLPAALLHPR